MSDEERRSQELRRRVFDLGLQDRQLSAAVERRAAEALGLNVTVSRALEVIDLRGPLPAGDLARDMQLSKAAITAIVTVLVEKGYAVRTRPDIDHRQVLIQISDHGRARRERIFGGDIDTAEELSDWSADDLRVVVEYFAASHEWHRRRLAAARNAPSG